MSGAPFCPNSGAPFCPNCGASHSDWKPWALMSGHAVNATEITPTPPNTPAGYSDEVVERAMALVRGAARYLKGNDSLFVDGLIDEARAIVALLPEPVDPDEQYARDLIREQGWQDERVIGSEAVVRMIAMARRGRALAAEGR